MNDPGALIAFLRARREQHIEFARRAGESNPNYDEDTFSDDDLGQMVDGFVEVLVEALRGEGTEKLDFYVSVVIPGLIAAGNPIEGIIQTVVGWTVRVVDDVARGFESPDAQATRNALGHFFGCYCRRMIEAAHGKAS